MSNVIEGFIPEGVRLTPESSEHAYETARYSIPICSAYWTEEDWERAKRWEPSPRFIRAVGLKWEFQGFNANGRPLYRAIGEE